VAHIDRRAEFFERAFHNLDGTDHTGTKAPRLRQNNLHEPNRCERLGLDFYHLRPMRNPTLVNPRFASQRLALDMWSTVAITSHRSDSMNPTEPDS
jgi:hypothetical protein